MGDKPNSGPDGRDGLDGAIRLPAKVTLPEDAEKLYQSLVRERADRQAYAMVAEKFDGLLKSRDFNSSFPFDGVEKSARALSEQLAKQWMDSPAAQKERQYFGALIEGNARFLADKGNPPTRDDIYQAVNNVSDAMANMLRRDQLYTDNAELNMKRSYLAFDTAQLNADPQPNEAMQQRKLTNAKMRVDLEGKLKAQNEKISTAPLVILMPLQLDEKGKELPPLQLDSPRITITDVVPTLPAGEQQQQQEGKKPLFRPVTPEEMAKNPALRGAVGRIRGSLKVTEPADGGDAPLFKPETIPDFPSYEQPKFKPHPLPGNKKEEPVKELTPEEEQRERLRRDLQNGAKIADEPEQDKRRSEAPEMPDGVKSALASDVKLDRDLKNALPNLVGSSRILGA